MPNRAVNAYERSNHPVRRRDFEKKTFSVEDGKMIILVKGD